MGTVTVKGEGGAVFDLDVPEEGTVQRELLDDALAKGRLTLVDDPDGALSEPEPEEVEADTEAEGGSPEIPPRSGRGSGLDAWVTFAAKATDAPESAYAALSRDEIIALLESEGVIEPEEG